MSIVAARRPAGLATSAIAALCVGVVGCTGSPTTDGPATGNSVPGSTAPADPAPGSSGTSAGGNTSADSVRACVAAQTEELTSAERLGQLFMVGLGAGGSGAGTDKAVRTYAVGGVILLGGWSGSAQVSEATARLSALARGPRLLLAADQEGGQVQQLTGAGFSDIPSAQRQAASPSTLRGNSARWGSELDAAGINLNLAPVADTVPPDVGVANAPIGRFQRQYGSTPAAVTPPVLAFLGGMHDAGIMTAVKHFPGIGRIRGNTDTSSSDITDPAATRGDPHLKPFAEAINAGTEFVMVSSARYPKIASGQALFAPDIVTGMLRDDLGFEGVVITDDVGAAAALAAVPVADRATRFIAAGGDMVLTAQPRDIPLMTAAVRRAIARDPRFAGRAQEALTRILTLKARRGLVDC